MTVPTRRTLLLFASLAPLGFLGYATPFALDLLIGLNGLLVILVLVDRRMAPGPAELQVERQGPESFSVGRASECRYMWRNSGQIGRAHV